MRRADTVTRTCMIQKGDVRVPYRSYLHYAPEIGYWVCLKDNHGTLVFNSDAYRLAATCRLILMDKLYELQEREERISLFAALQIVSNKQMIRRAI